MILEVIDDVISKDYADYIHSLISEENFPWYYKKNIVTHHYENVDENINGFMHQLYENRKSVSPYFNSLYPLILNISEKSGIKFNMLDRMRFNFVQGNFKSKLLHHMPHIDNYVPHLVAIYYVNSCDGDTVIFNEFLESPDLESDEAMIADNNWTEKLIVTPKKGRMVVFDGRYYHASSYTKLQPYRCVINSNLAII